MSSISQVDIIRKNISAISEVQREETITRRPVDRLADRITDFSGSMLFVLIHMIWFGLWVMLNIGLVSVPGISEFDPFPFGLLTMIVSLEAIFLSTFVLISQNRMARQSEQRAELDLHINLLAEQKATKVLEMLDQIAQQLNQSSSRFNFAPDPEVEALKVSPEPQEVIQVIQESIQEQTVEVSQEVNRAVEEITGEMDTIKEEVKDITGEMQAVREEIEQIEPVKKEVEQINEKVELIGSNVQHIKREIKD